MSNKKQFSKNLTINGLNFLVNVAIGLLMTPFLVSNLGISAFGLVQIAISISLYSSILSTSLNQSNNRFVSISLAQDSKEQTNTLLSTILSLYTLSFIVILPFILFIFFFPDYIFDIDSKLLEEASYMFLLVGISQLFVMQTTAFMSPAYANNRLDIIQSINILRNFLKLIFVLTFILFVSDSLVSVGVAFFIASIISVVIGYMNFKKFVPFYIYNFKDFDWSNAKKIFKLSGWTIVSVLGTLLFLQTDVILVNIFLGAEESGKFAVLIQWVMLLIAVSTVLSVVISPMILNKYAYDKIDELKILLYKSIKFQGIFTAIPVALVFVYADLILELWLGVEYKHLSAYLQIMIMHFGIVQATRQLMTVNTAYNKMKWHGIMTLVFGFFHIVISAILLNYTTFGVWGIILSNLTFTILLNLGFLSWYVSRYLKEPLKKIYFMLAPAFIVQVYMTLVAYLFYQYLEPYSWVGLFMNMSVSLLFVLPFIYLVFLSKNEKIEIVNHIKRKL